MAPKVWCYVCHVSTANIGHEERPFHRLLAAKGRDLFPGEIAEIGAEVEAFCRQVPSGQTTPDTSRCIQDIVMWRVLRQVQEEREDRRVAGMVERMVRRLVD